MQLHFFVMTALLVAGCGGSDQSAQTSGPGVPEIYRTIIEADGIPFEVSWDRNDRTRATARIFGTTQGGVVDPSTVIGQATGCKVTSVPARVASDDDIPTYVADTNCAPARVLNEQDVIASRDLAREIDFAVAQVAQEPQAAAAVPTAIPAASLHEGSPFLAFTASDIERYCAEPWTTRIGSNGRTEYNPCKRRDAFE